MIHLFSRYDKGFLSDHKWANTCLQHNGYLWQREGFALCWTYVSVHYSETYSEVIFHHKNGNLHTAIWRFFSKERLEMIGKVLDLANSKIISSFQGPKRLFRSRIWDSHIRGYEGFCPLGSGVHPTCPLGTRGPFLRGKVAGTWSWPLTFKQCRSQENMDLYIQSSIRLHGIVLN
jgi:hypothetical protein